MALFVLGPVFSTAALYVTVFGRARRLNGSVSATIMTSRALANGGFAMPIKMMLGHRSLPRPWIVYAPTRVTVDVEAVPAGYAVQITPGAAPWFTATITADPPRHRSRITFDFQPVNEVKSRSLSISAVPATLTSSPAARPLTPSRGLQALPEAPVDVSLEIRRLPRMPDATTDEGMMTRLFIAEAAGPGNDPDGEAQAMGWMRRVIANRQDHPRKFAATGNSVDAVVTASGQFQGFNAYPTLSESVDGNIAGKVAIAMDGSDRRQPLYATFVQAAIDAASAPPPPDPCPTGLYFWRTEGAGGPGGQATAFKSLGHNTFYTLPAKFFQ